MPDSNHRSPLTLEDLLHLKRAERPSPEFWTRFESELRQKQLAALLERRPWWQVLPHFITQRRSFIPIGATAILAFTFVSVKYYAPDRVAPMEHSDAVQLIAPVQLASTTVVASTFLQKEAVAVPAASSASDINDNLVVVAVEPFSGQLPDRAAELTPWSAPIPSQSPSARFITANINQLERTTPELAQTKYNNPVPTASSQLERSSGAVAELATVSAMASKRNRLLAGFSERQFTPEPQAPALVRERLTRRLADATFSEHFSRVGLKGDQVSLRF